MHSARLTFETLPDTIPIFPLTGVLLLPQGQLPLNIFEPRYLEMVNHSMATHRMIGMIQPRSAGSADLYDIGCAGYITGFTETDQEQYLITLTGICRFKIKSEQKNSKPFRIISPEWQNYKTDMTQQPETIAIDRTRLNTLLQAYFKKQEMSCDWDKVDIAPDADLLTALAMICPLGPAEKQALLESPNIQTRTELFMTLIEMAANSDDTCCH